MKSPQRGEEIVTCTVITCEPNTAMVELNDRMPVLLTEKQFEPWLSAEAGPELLKPASEDFLQRWPVSKRVNSSRATDDDPTLIDPISL